MVFRILKNKLLGWHRVGAISGVLISLTGFSASALDGYRVAIVDIRGEWRDDAAHVSWTTEVETGSEGFRVYRVQDGQTVPLHTGWLSADLFTGSGQTYTVIDPAAVKGEAGRYRIEELRLSGVIRALGEWELVFEAPVQKRAIAYQPLEEPMEVFSGPTEGPAVKVPVVDHDLYAVSLSAIADGLGLAPAQVADLASHADLRVHAQGQSVAYLYEANHEQIVFYGWPMTNRYTRTNYFWIEPGPGQHMARVEPDPEPVSTNLTHMAHRYFKQDGFLTMDRFQALPDDFYYWTTFNADSPTIDQREVPLTLDGYAGGGAELRVNLHGWRHTANDPTHIIEFDWNEVPIAGDWSFSGIGSYTAHVEIAHALIEPATNTLVIRGVQSASLFVLHHLWTDYERYYAPAEQLLLAPDGGHDRLTADLFADAVVFDVSDPLAPIWIADASGAVDAGTSWPVSAGSWWAMRERSDLPAPEPIPAGFGTWLREPTNTVDYLVVAPRAFEAPAQAMAAYRASLGLRSAVAIFEDICDEFAYGLKTPDAIRDLLIYAHANWHAAPRWVLLGGWGHFDYLNVSTDATNWLPPLMGSDGSSLRPADVQFADLTGDGAPEVAIGRLPVQTVAQFDAYLAKLQAYEASGPQPSYQASLFVSGLSDGAGDFLATNTELSHVITNRYEPSFAAQDLDDWWTVKQHTLAGLTNSSGILHYTGHGSITVIADKGTQPALSVADVNALPAHDPLPLFISLTCYMGRFDHHLASQRCLAESLVLKPDGGAVAVYSPSGLSFNYFAALYATEFYRRHAIEGADTLGTTLKRTRRHILTNVMHSATAIRTYNLLGDPALRLRGGEAGMVPPTVTTFTEWRWEQFANADLSDPAISGPEAIPNPAGANNLQTYAFGNHSPLLVGWAPDGGELQIEWRQRALAEDLSVELLSTIDLDLPWSVLPPEWPPEPWHVGPAGMTGWRVRLPKGEWAPGANNVFFKLRARLD